MAFDDFLEDAKLHIETTGRDASCETANVRAYEPTSYSVLERILEEGCISSGDHLIDYGSGKGRVCIFFSDRTGCKAAGIELVRRFYEKARENLRSYSMNSSKEADIEFFNEKAQDFELPDTASVLFFFNPFSHKTFRAVMKRVTESYERAPRLIRLFFYYPENAYIAYLSGLDEVMFSDEIDCRDLFPEEDDRNRVMIFEMGQDLPGKNCQNFQGQISRLQQSIGSVS